MLGLGAPQRKAIPSFTWTPLTTPWII